MVTMEMVLLTALVVLVKEVVSNAISNAVALVLEVVEAAEARRAPNFMHWNSTINIVGVIGHRIINILDFWGRAVGRRIGG
jgi:hypothetical protein